jgi:hypothetical protein
MSSVVTALAVYCPLCLARPGAACENVVRGGWIAARAEPHHIRVLAAQEVTADETGHLQ